VIPRLFWYMSVVGSLMTLSAQVTPTLVGTAVVAPGHARRLWDGGQHRPRCALAGHGPALPRAFGAGSPRLPTKVGSYEG